jgi:hypothetical protein
VVFAAHFGFGLCSVGPGDTCPSVALLILGGMVEVDVVAGADEEIRFELADCK